VSTPLRFLGLGGTDEVGASSYLYLLKEGNLLIDAGLRPGQVGEAALPKLDVLAEHPPSAIVLTHAHLDHVAALPVVIRRFPGLRIHCTEATARLAAVVLADTLKVSTDQGAPMFSIGELKRTLERLQPTPYFEWVRDYRFAFKLLPAGHLLGAASVLIRSGGRQVLHTGDVSNVATPVVDPVWLPHPNTIGEIDAVVSEATYGDTQLPARKEQVRTFLQAIGETLRGGGRVLIPSFALGRAQEITQILQTGMASGLLPQTPIYLDGLTRRMTETYEELLPLMPEAIQNRAKSSGQSPFRSGTVELVENRKARERILRSEQASVVIASSSMLHAGASPQYARAWLPEPGNALFVVGYQDAESPGRRLLELKQGGEVLLPDGRGGPGVRPRGTLLSLGTRRPGRVDHPDLALWAR